MNIAKTQLMVLSRRHKAQEASVNVWLEGEPLQNKSSVKIGTWESRWTTSSLGSSMYTNSINNAWLVWQKFEEIAITYRAELENYCIRLLFSLILTIAV